MIDNQIGLFYVRKQEIQKYIFKIELDKVIANVFKGQQWISNLLKGNFSKRGNNKLGGNRRKGKSYLKGAGW